MCRPRRISVTMLVAVCWASGPALRAQSAPEGLAGRIERLISQLPQSTQVGIVVLNVDDGSVWFSHEPNRPLKPASVMKLFVMAAAIEHLGPDFAFTTEVYLHDDELWIRGGGDPGLGDERLAKRRGEQVMSVLDDWASRLRSRGVKSVRRIVVDDSIFDREFRHPDWPPDQSQRWYQAPVGGLNFNDNCLDARIVVGGQRIELELVPPLPESFLDNRLKRGSKNTAIINRLPDSDVFVLSGSVAKSVQLEPISVRRPAVFFGHALRQALESGGIRAGDAVVRRAISQDALNSATRIAVQRTSLSEILWRIGVFSQNLFAECTLKALGAYGPGGAKRGSAGSWAEGLTVLRATVETLGIDLSGAVLRDGSGLSHKNRVSAAQVVELLRIMRRHRHSRLLLDNLASLDDIGTLRRRFREPVLPGTLRAKTGSIRDVSALAGYLERPGSNTIAFAILINGETKRAKQVENAIVRLLAGDP